ncbi:MAG: hypothetical protein K6L80_12090 [Agarilytica sp.]
MKYFLILMFLVMPEIGVASDNISCEKEALDTYKGFREALLNPNFEPHLVESYFAKDYRKNIKKGMYLRHFQSLRVVESKLAKIIEYSTQCKPSGTVIIKFKTVNFDSEYNRRLVRVKKIKSKNIITMSSDEKASESFDKNTNYKAYEPNT